MHRHTSVFVFLLLLAAVTVAVAQSQPAASKAVNSAATPDIDTIVAHLEQAQLENRSHYRPYTVTREYRMYSGLEAKPASEVVAEVNFVPPNSKTFDIKQASGSSRGEKVVRNILKEEQESAPHYERNSLTRDNYQFHYLGQEMLEGNPCYVLEIIPKRQEKDLVKGRAWIDAKTYLVHRVQGDLSKSPSWWLKAVHVTQEFKDIAGMWLPTRTQAVADVRIFGAHSLDSQAVNFKTAETLAQKVAPKARAVPRPTRPQLVTGSIVLMRR